MIMTSFERTGIFEVDDSSSNASCKVAFGKDSEYKILDVSEACGR